MNKRVLIEDKLIYFTEVYSARESEEYYETLKNTIDWNQDEIIIFGKKTKIPRMSSWYADSDVKYKYSGLELINREWTAILTELKRKAEELAECDFNSVLLNHYRGGTDSMGWHADDETELGKNPTIASVTFGYPRRFLIRDKENQSEKKEISLEDGSLLVMRGDFQEKYHHSVPKTAKKVGERINLTFRKIYN